MSRLLLMGAGGHGKVVAEAAVACGQWAEIAFLDGLYPGHSRALDWPVVGSDREAAVFLSDYPEIFVALGDNHLRTTKIADLVKVGFRIPVIVHPAAWVSPSAKLGDGTVVVAGAVVNAGANLGFGCIVNTGATVDHDCRLADGVHISPGAHVGGDSTIGAYTWIGIGAAIRHGIQIGARVIVGAGAAVVSDLPSDVVANGVPARIA